MQLNGKTGDYEKTEEKTVEDEYAYFLLTAYLQEVFSLSEKLR